MINVAKIHDVGVLAMHGFVPFDLGIPCDVFARAGTAGGRKPYRVRVCGEAGEVSTGAFSLRTHWTLDDLVGCDTVIIPGVEDPSQDVSWAVIQTIRQAWTNGARIASICSGAFVLASTGLLDGLQATTHWIAAAELARRFPAVAVNPDVLFVDTGRIITSAGAAAGIDMCLHIVRLDHGQATAAAAARLAVTPLNRDGGQAQFIRHEPPDSSASVVHVLDWMQKNAHRQLNVRTLAARAGMSPRTFARRFIQQTGTTPLQWLIRTRIMLAKAMLETTSASIDEVGEASGFDSRVTFRARFRKLVGLSPSAYRGAARRNRPDIAECFGGN